MPARSAGPFGIELTTRMLPAVKVTFRPMLPVCSDATLARHFVGLILRMGIDPADHPLDRTIYQRLLLHAARRPEIVEHALQRPDDHVRIP